jgi:hypothetical protein
MLEIPNFVTNIWTFSHFMSGLCHISELSSGWLAKPEDVSILF